MSETDLKHCILAVAFVAFIFVASAIAFDNGGKHERFCKANSAEALFTPCTLADVSAKRGWKR